MKNILLILAVCWSFVLVAERPYLIFPENKVAQLRTEEGKAKVLDVLAKSKKDNIEALSLAYRVTGDAQYAQKVRELLLKNCGPAIDGKPVKEWGWALSGAHKCYLMTVGYDSIYDFLTPADREIIAAGLLERGVRPLLNEWLLGDTRTTVLDSMGHNFWSACVFMPGVALLALNRDNPEEREWLKLIADATVEWVDYPGSIVNNKPRTFDRNGGYYESVGYGAFALSNYLIFRLAWQNSGRTPLPVPAVLDKVGDFFINSCYPDSQKLMSLNFGDSSLYAVGSQPLVLLTATGMGKPRYLWYLQQTAESDYKEGIAAASPLGLVYYPTAAELAGAMKTPDLPTVTAYPDMGWCILRNSWEKDATLLAVKSGFTWNHAHADAGSFILFHQGENILIDSGNCWYPNVEYDQYYRQSTAHNVILFDSKGSNPEDTYFGSKFPGTVQYPMDAGDWKYVLADATGPNAQNFIRFYRNLVWLDDVIIIYDDLKTYTEGKFEWLLHYDGEAKRTGLDLNIQKGKAKVAVRPLFPERFPEGFPHDAPERVSLTEKSGLKDHEQKTPVPYFAIVPPGKERVMKFVTAILLNPDQPPKIERLQAVDASGVRITRGQRVTELWINHLADGRMRHRNSNQTLAGYDTDAAMLVVSRLGNAAPDRFMVIDGSYLRREGKVLLNTLTKVFAEIKDGKTVIYPQ